jgi:preprotein translocase subunit YajC
MFSIISDAQAQTAGAATGGMEASPIIMIVLMIVAMYFLVMRPQQKKAKEHQALLSALAKGDEVITQGGIAGTISSVGDNFVKVEVARGVEISMQKSAIASVLPKGSLDNA